MHIMQNVKRNMNFVFALGHYGRIIVVTNTRLVEERRKPIAMIVSTGVKSVFLV